MENPSPFNFTIEDFATGARMGIPPDELADVERFARRVLQGKTMDRLAQRMMQGTLLVTIDDPSGAIDLLTCVLLLLAVGAKMHNDPRLVLLLKAIPDDEEERYTRLLDHDLDTRSTRENVRG